jgi:CRP-like cAMP-binding protein
MSLPEPLDGLAIEERTVLERYLEPVEFPAGTLLFEEGSAGDGCYIIDGGEVRLELARPEVDSDGVLGFLEPGSIVGELSLLDSLPRSASAWSHTDVKLRRLSAAAIERLLEEHPRIGVQVYRALGRDAARKLRATTRRLAEFAVTDPDPDVHETVERARQAIRAFEPWTDERVDGLLGQVAQAVAARAEELATATVKETHLGNVPDKARKNQMASLGVYQALVGRPGRGPLQTHADRGVTELASPAGVIFALIPMTNPVATAVFKTLIALKGGNALILSFHRAALGVGNATGELIRGVLEQAGAPPDLVQWIQKRSSRKKTAMYLGHPGVSLVLATGGAGMVRAAYSSGTPAIGVGPANTPTLICADADPDQVAQAVVMSKSFDNGLICGAEHNLIVERPHPGRGGAHRRRVAHEPARRREDLPRVVAVHGGERGRGHRVGAAAARVPRGRPHGGHPYAGPVPHGAVRPRGPGRPDPRELTVGAGRGGARERARAVVHATAG